MSNLKLIRNGESLDFKSFVFPGGEVGIKLNTSTTSYYASTGFFGPSYGQTILARIQSSQDLIELAMLKDAVERVVTTPTNLIMPYVPYGRQDRVCDKGESFSLKVLCNFINSLKFDKITVLDPHSEVTSALLDRVKVITQFDIINKNLELAKRLSSCVLVSPDAGANKKTFEIAKFLGHINFVRADKLRDLTNGNIKETIVYTDSFNGADVACIDDICDGGRTFIELAKVCKAKGCGKFVLYVTHGIFSKGTQVLFDGGIDEIWSTDSYKEGLELNKINVFKVDKLLL